MGRQIALAAVSATIYAVLVCGCGPRDAAQTVQGGAPVTLEVKAGQTTAGKRPVTRAEVFDWWDAGVRNSRSLTTTDIKSKYGPPDTTYEKEFTASAKLMWRFNSLRPWALNAMTKCAAPTG